MERMTGTITQVRLNKGFAFVRSETDGLSRFVYAKDVEPMCDFDTLREGLGVTFVPTGTLDTRPNAKNNGLRGIKVQVIK